MSSVDSTTPKVLIVGSGPSGLILALSLRRNGIPVRVIDKNTEHKLGQRGAGITPRSLELFESLGVYQEVVSRGMSMPLIRMYKMPEGIEILKEFAPAPWEASTPSTPYNNFVTLGQNNVEKILRAELSKCGCEVELGVDLLTVDQSDDQVKVTLLKRRINDQMEDTGLVKEETVYDWVIGADGAKGTVRRALGLKLLGETTTQTFVVGDVEIEGLVADKWHMWGVMGSDFLSLRGTEDEGIYNFMASGTKLGNPEEVCTSDESVISTIKSFIGQRTDIKFGKITWKSPYRLNIRMAETFNMGRVFLTGDAAHAHSPAGGQGMNTGIQDSFNLGWKLALVIKGVSPPSLLGTFNEERVPVVSQMLSITTDLLKKTVANKDNAGWDRSEKSIKQLGVNYRWSSIVVDEEKELLGEDDIKSLAYDIETDGILSAGDRAPDATELSIANHSQAGKITRLFRLFSPAKHTVLLFAAQSDYQSALSTLKKYPGELVQSVLITEAGKAANLAVSASEHNFTVLEDTKGYAQGAYRAKEGTSGILVIRPDGVVGARVGNSEGIVRYFRAIFS